MQAMNERTMQFRVGVMILATILIAVILVSLFMGSSPLLHGTYTIYIKFNNAPGVTRNTPVRKDGIRIGRVRNVQFAKDDTGVIVTADIESDRHLYSDEQCKVPSPVLMGDASLDFVPIENFPGEKVPIEDWRHPGRQDGAGHDRLDCRPARKGRRNPGRRSTRPAADIDRLANRVDQLVERNEQQITDTISEAHETLKLLQQTLERQQ